MIDLILKAEGARWERPVSGWKEIQTALWEFADFDPGGDDYSLTFYGDRREIAITLLMQSDHGEVSIPRQLTETAANIRVQEIGGEWLAYQSMSIFLMRSDWQENYVKIVLRYS